MNTYDVSLVSCEGYDDRQVETALRAVLEPIHGLDFVHPGVTVGVKVTLRRIEILYKHVISAALSSCYNETGDRKGGCEVVGTTDFPL